MSSQEFSPEWVLLNRSARADAEPVHNDKELRTVAGQLWPRVEAHARRELANTKSDDDVVLVAEVWEGLLQSVSKTLRRRHEKGLGIVDLEAYLFGAFQHRFNRAMRKERRRQETIELVPFSRDLEQLPGARDMKSARDLERSVQVKQAVQSMDDWTHKVWTARQYGYSWREIAEHMGLNENQAKLRFRYQIRRLRDRLGSGT